MEINDRGLRFTSRFERCCRGLNDTRGHSEADRTLNRNRRRRRRRRRKKMMTTTLGRTGRGGPHLSGTVFPSLHSSKALAAGFKRVTCDV